MLNKAYIGIDIGHNGGICFINKDNSIETYPMPMIKTSLDVGSFKNFFNWITPGGGLVVFEKLGVIFGSSKTTAFSMGYQTGIVEGVCVAMGIPYIAIPAKEWQRAMFVGVDEITKPAKKTSKTGKPVRDTKAMALVAIKRRFPDLKLTFGDKATKPHDGLVDSVLIAAYAKQMNL